MDVTKLLLHLERHIMKLMQTAFGYLRTRFLILHNQQQINIFLVNGLGNDNDQNLSGTLQFLIQVSLFL
jgi:hypothetical protein